MTEDEAEDLVFDLLEARTSTSLYRMKAKVVGALMNRDEILKLHTLLVRAREEIEEWAVKHPCCDHTDPELLREIDEAIGTT